MTRTLMAGAVMLLTAFCVPGHAQTYPAKPVRVLIPYNPGGSPDLLSRLVAQHLTPLLGQGFVIENKAGGGGVPAIMDMLNAPADGYTLLSADLGQWGIYPAVQTNAPYDAVRDFAPVGLIFTSIPFLIVSGTSPAKDLRELVAMAKAKPGMAYGSMGVGALTHLEAEAFAAGMGLSFTHVPYKGGGAAVEAVMRGDVAFTITALGTFAGQLKSGAVRILATTHARRMRAMPEVPTVQEAVGLQGYHFAGTAGWIAKAGTPKSVIDRLSTVLMRVASYPELAERGLALGVEMTPSTPEEHADIIRSDVKRLADAVRISGARAQ